MRYGATVYETLRVCGYTIEHFSETMVMDKAVMVPVAPQPIAWADVPDRPSATCVMSAVDRLAWLKQSYQRSKILIKPELRDPAVNAAVFENVWTDTTGRQKLMNMHMEKNYTLEQAHEADWRSFGFAHSADSFGFKLQHVRAIKRSMLVPVLLSDRAMLTETAVISRERMEAATAYMAEHEAQLIETFKVRDRCKETTERNVAWGVTFLNKLLGEWNFVHIKRKQYKIQKDNVTTSVNKYHVYSTCDKAGGFCTSRW